MTAVGSSGQLPLLFSEDHDDFRQSVRDFGRVYADSYLPMSRSDEFPWELNRTLGEQGLLGLGVSDRYGGQGSEGKAVDRVFSGIAVEELTYSNFYAGMLVFPGTMNGRLLEAHMNPELAETWIPAIVSGEKTVSFALTEPAAGSDAGGITTRAEKVEGGWKLNGEKTAITSAPHASAFITVANTDPKLKARAATAFFVPRESEGLAFQVFDDAGWKPLGRGGISYDDVFVPDNHVIGPVNGVFREVMQGFDFARALIGLTAVGVARRVIDMTIAFAKERQAFGRPISKFQGVAFPLAEHVTYLEGVRALCYRTLALGDAGRPHTTEASMVKWWAPQVAINAVRDCIVINGHSAFTEELPFQALLRDVSGFELADGTPQIQKTVITRSLFGREFAPQ
jgi:cyclohexanecarboxyl-CoA dehydrogenase